MVKLPLADHAQKSRYFHRTVTSEKTKSCSKIEVLSQNCHIRENKSWSEKTSEKTNHVVQNTFKIT